MAEQLRRPFEKFVDSPYYCGDGLFIEVPPLASDAILTTLHPLLQNELQTVCCKLRGIVEPAVLNPRTFHAAVVNT
jgi:hypothetical protein